MSLLRSLRDERLPRRPVLALLAAVATIVVGERVFAAVVERAVDARSGFPAWLPEFGSIGETVVVYATLFDVLQFVVIPLLLVWFGYELGQTRATAPAEDDRQPSPRA